MIIINQQKLEIFATTTISNMKVMIIKIKGYERISE